MSKLRLRPRLVKMVWVTPLRRIVRAMPEISNGRYSKASLHWLDLIPGYLPVTWHNLVRHQIYRWVFFNSFVIITIIKQNYTSTVDISKEVLISDVSEYCIYFHWHCIHPILPIFDERYIIVEKTLSLNFDNIFHRLNDIFGKKSTMGIICAPFYSDNFIGAWLICCKVK